MIWFYYCFVCLFTLYNLELSFLQNQINTCRTTSNTSKEDHVKASAILLKHLLPVRQSYITLQNRMTILASMLSPSFQMFRRLPCGFDIMETSHKNSVKSVKTVVFKSVTRKCSR